MNKVYIGIPSYDATIHYGIMDAVFQASKKGQATIAQNANVSWLTKNFNILLCDALNAREKLGITHFCMIHADIVPLKQGWLDKMLEIMEAHEADVLSAVSPIKSMDGFTSTALDEPLPGHNPRWRVRRLTMHEIYSQPQPTFTDPKLLINTGLMLIDIRPREDAWFEKIRFHFEDQIIKNDGKFRAVGMPEDWLFSREAKALGAKLYATREIALKHIGPMGFFNDRPFGTKRTDA